jgi:hypothetical protein
MARYHFHLVDENIALDLEVADLADYEAMLKRAEQLGAELLLNQPDVYGKNPDAWEIRVTDDNGSEVLALSLSEVAGKQSH